MISACDFVKLTLLLCVAFPLRHGNIWQSVGHQGSIGLQHDIFFLERSADYVAFTSSARSFLHSGVSYSLSEHFKTLGNARKTAGSQASVLISPSSEVTGFPIINVTRVVTFRSFKSVTEIASLCFVLLGYNCSPSVLFMLF